jgi:hypothetical protein
MIDPPQIELIATKREVVVAKEGDERFEVDAIRVNGVARDVPLVGEIVEKVSDFVLHARRPETPNVEW